MHGSGGEFGIPLRCGLLAEIEPSSYFVRRDFAVVLDEDDVLQFSDDTGSVPGEICTVYIYLILPQSNISMQIGQDWLAQVSKQILPNRYSLNHL